MLLIVTISYYYPCRLVLVGTKLTYRRLGGDRNSDFKQTSDTTNFLQEAHLLKLAELYYLSSEASSFKPQV
jgi:hypothetical protein